MLKTIQPCRKCRTWAGCPGKGWYSIGEFRFCRLQIQWLIAEFLRVWADEIIVMRDTWPREDRETGYTEAPPTQHAIRPGAPFERPLQIVGEIRARLSKTGQDGRELVLMVENKSDELSTRARNALNYCSGWRRKRDYGDWLKQRTWRHTLVK